MSPAAEKRNGPFHSRTVQNRERFWAGKILYDDGNGPVDLVGYSPDSKAMRRLRGKDISMIFQEPMASLSPVYTIGAQMMEAVIVHQEKRIKRRLRSCACKCCAP